MSKRKTRVPTLPASFTGKRVKGHCRWCDRAIENPDGSICTGRTWHPECVTEYRIAMFSDDQRRAVFTRDRGVCSGCGKDTLAEDEYHRRGYRNTGDLWQADHVKPLFRSNGNMEFFKLANLQTLCTRCHKVKSNADRKGEGVGPIEHTPPLL